MIKTLEELRQEMDTAWADWWDAADAAVVDDDYAAWSAAYATARAVWDAAYAAWGAWYDAYNKRLKELADEDT
jgi:hypothetical protein